MRAFANQLAHKEDKYIAQKLGITLKKANQLTKEDLKHIYTECPICHQPLTADKLFMSRTQPRVEMLNDNNGNLRGKVSIRVRLACAKCSGVPG